MSDTVKLIIEIPEKEYEAFKELIAINISGRCSGKGIIQTCLNAVKNGIPLANDSEKAEVQAYFDGEAYGWEQGRKVLVDDVKAEIEEKISHYNHFQGSNTAHGLEIALEIIDKHISGEGDKE